MPKLPVLCYKFRPTPARDPMPAIGQLLLLIAAACCLAAAGVIVVTRRPPLQFLRQPLGWVGVALCGATLALHAVSRDDWVPLSDNFDALVWLGMLLAAFVFYIQLHRPIGGIELVLLPVAVALLVLAAVSWRAFPHEYVDSTWSITHRLTSYGAVLGLCIAGAVGATYLLQHRNLRRRGAAVEGGRISLERAERITFAAVTVGFALLTLTGVMGVLKALSMKGQTRMELTSPKVFITAAAWVVSAIVLNTPISPRLRGRKVAWLSVVGMALVVVVAAVVQVRPSK